jgi:hypothetical protein
VALGPISLADRLRALALLDPRDARTASFMLDVMRPRDFQGDVRRAAYRAAAAHPPAPPATSSALLLGGGQPATLPVAAVQKPSPSFPRSNATRVISLAPRPIAAPAPSGIPRLAGIGSVPTRQPLPLIDFGKARAVLTALVATRTPSGAIDISALLQRMARGLSLHRLHRLKVWSVRRGAQLLVDCSPAMTPLRYDSDSIGSRLELILGDRLQRLHFDSCPSRGTGVGERSRWKPWEAPMPGIPVVVLTDLGCAGPQGNPEWASSEEWGNFADKARRSGISLIALAPYPARRLPPSLKRRVTVVSWCEDLGAARVRRILRDARMKR